MADYPIVRFCTQRERHTDCAVAAFAMCIGLSYSEALIAIAAVAPRVLTEGTDCRELQQAAARQGVVLVVKRRFDLDDLDEEGGILVLRGRDGEEHAVYFKRGLIFDGRSESVWDADVYLRAHRARVMTMLVRRD